MRKTSLPQYERLHEQFNGVEKRCVFPRLQMNQKLEFPKRRHYTFVRPTVIIYTSKKKKYNELIHKIPNPTNYFSSGDSWISYRFSYCVILRRTCPAWRNDNPGPEPSSSGPGKGDEMCIDGSRRERADLMRVRVFFVIVWPADGDACTRVREVGMGEGEGLVDRNKG